MAKYVLGHKNPDTDSIVSAIMFSEFMKNMNQEIIPVKLGKLNRETEFLLKECNFSDIKQVSTLPVDSEITLVDHNERGQTIDNFEELKLVEIIDHHKVKLSIDSPIWIRTEIIGSTASIIAKLYFENEIEIEKNQAKLLIGAILSDTLHFRSPTTTIMDKEIVEELNKIAEISNLEEFAKNLFDAKSDLGDITTEDLIKLDYKEFSFGGKKYGIGVMETTNPKFALDKKLEIVEKMEEIKKSDELDGILFSIIDILNEKNTTIVSDSNEEEVIKAVFKGQELEHNVYSLGNIVSRKKQIVPKLEAHFN